jgi:hypothetical protein
VQGVSPRGRDVEGCETGTSIGPVDHLAAFGSPGSTFDFRACNLPEYPAENHRVCYRTTIDLCETGYRIYLNRRNFESLAQKCQEQEALAMTEEEVIFPSPRYQCKKRNGKVYQYRSRELCLYNISLPNCESGSVLVQPTEEDPQELEDRKEDGLCADYIQFYYSSDDNPIVWTNQLCGTNLNETTIPATQFMALFWSDTNKNRLGFKLRAKCQDVTGSG